MLNNSSEEMFCIANIAMTNRTSKIVERLFGLAKLTLDDQRKRVLPMHLEHQIFLFANKRLWNINKVDRSRCC